MAPKKQKISASQSAAIQPTFVSPEAKERYQKSLVGKKCIQERGFDNPMREFKRAIQERHWEEFSKQPGAVLVPIIREFYANAREHNNFRTLVRGKWVSFDGKTINQKLAIPELDDDAHTTLKNQDPNYDEILVFLAKPGTKWTISQDVLLHFPTNCLKDEAKVWHYFISAKLLPTNHISQVSKERALLNYAIQTGLSINVGKVIEASILRMAQGKTRSGGFGYPSLVYDLCLQAGVKTGPNEEVQQPRSAITPSMIRRVAPKYREVYFGKSQSQPSTSRSAATPPPAMRDAMHHINQRLDQYFARQEQLSAYLMQCHALLASALPTPIQLPPPPVFPPEAATGDEQALASASESDSENSNGDSGDSDAADTNDADVDDGDCEDAD